MRRFETKIAIVTGGAQGIGLTAVESFAKEGATVAIWDFDEAKGKREALRLKEAGFSVVFSKVDVASLEDTATAAEELLTNFGRIDILINNAGITRDASLLKMTAEQWSQVIAVNLTGVFHCTKAVAPAMIRQGWGRIVNTSSVVGLYGNFGQTNYVATKSGVIGMTKVWARELARKGVTVNAVAPGFIATEMITTVPDKVIQGVLERTPVGRLGTPHDIAAAYLFLASEEASFINGAILSVDGGLIS